MDREGRLGSLVASRDFRAPRSRTAWPVYGPTTRGLPQYVFSIAPTPTPSTRRLIEIITQLGRRLGVEPAPAPATRHRRIITTHT